MTQSKLHPLADLALQLLSSGVDEAYAYDKKAVEKLVVALRPYLGSAELRPAVEALVVVARHLSEKLKSKKAGAALIQVASTAIEALKAQSPRAQMERVQNRARSFARFGGTETTKREVTPLRVSIDPEILRRRAVATMSRVR
jgi:hypothetical protein